MATSQSSAQPMYITCASSPGKLLISSGPSSGNASTCASPMPSPSRDKMTTDNLQAFNAAFNAVNADQNVHNTLSFSTLLLAQDIMDDTTDEPPSDSMEEAGDAQCEACDPALLSAGSVGHAKNLCGLPCKFVRKCKDGLACKRCHLCKWSKGKEREKREEADKEDVAIDEQVSQDLPSSEPTYLVQLDGGNICASPKPPSSPLQAASPATSFPPPPPGLELIHLPQSGASPFAGAFAGLQDRLASPMEEGRRAQLQNSGKSTVAQQQFLAAAPALPFQGNAPAACVLSTAGPGASGLPRPSAFGFDRFTDRPTFSTTPSQKLSSTPTVAQNAFAAATRRGPVCDFQPGAAMHTPAHGYGYTPCAR